MFTLNPQFKNKLEDDGTLLDWVKDKHWQQHRNRAGIHYAWELNLDFYQILISCLMFVFCLV